MFFMLCISMIFEAQNLSIKQGMFRDAVQFNDNVPLGFVYASFNRTHA